MQDVLIVVDMQNDFISGALGTLAAQHIVPAVADKIKSFEGAILFTRDTHEPDYLTTQEGTLLPVAHCIKDTEGWEIAPQLLEMAKDKTIIDKPAFGSLALAEHMQAMHKQTPIRSITLVGLCTDICVISNALILKAALPETQVLVDAACCAGATHEGHLVALEAMKACQIKVYNEEEK